jgi:hypothetical protein
MKDLQQNRHSTYRLNTVRQNLGELYLSQVEEFGDEHTDSSTANTDGVLVMPEAISSTHLEALRVLRLVFLLVMVTSSTLVNDTGRRSPMLPICHLPESLSNHRRSQLSHRLL